MEVIHPYGSLGTLPNGSNEPSPFGADIEPHDLYRMQQNILTYSESLEEDRRAEKISAMLGPSEKVLFLGFAFHSQNMKLLRFNKRVAPRQIYATTVGLKTPKWSAAEARMYKSLNQSRGSTEIATSPNSCDELITDYADHWTD